MVYEFEGRTEKDAIEQAANELGLECDQFDVEILETQKGTLFKKGFVKIRVHTVDQKGHLNAPKNKVAVPKETDLNVTIDDFEKKLMEFISTVITKMGYTVKVNIIFREEHKIGVRLDSPNSSALIGRRGKNLDALQLLANVYAGNLGREDIRVILDAENYRIRREETLVRLAYNTADKVNSSHNSVLLEPMNPFERRIIHTTLNDVPNVETKSEGEGLYKRVRVLYKRIG